MQGGPSRPLGAFTRVSAVSWACHVPEASFRFSSPPVPDDFPPELPPDHRRPVELSTSGYLSCIQSINPAFVYRPKYEIPKRVLTNPREPAGNGGLDNASGDLIVRVGDILGPGTERQRGWRAGGRYSVVEVLGHGTFGQVFRCRDEERKTLVAVKVLKNKPAYFKQGLVEVGVLVAMNTNADRTGERHTLRLLDHFVCHNHLCIVTELLGINLYDLIKKNDFRGVSVSLIRSFIQQMLLALVATEEVGVVHCDLKPENILLNKYAMYHLSLIDFGSACFEDLPIYTYIQSRHYRAPEVILGLEYSPAIDMWSLGCIAAELFLGVPIFPGSSEHNQLFKMISMLGPIPDELVKTGSKGYSFFTKEPLPQRFASSAPTSFPGTDSTGQRPAHVYRLKNKAEFEMDNDVEIEEDKQFYVYRTLEEMVYRHPFKTGTDPKDPNPAYSDQEIRRSFLDFLRGCFEYDPTKRLTAAQALYHPFVTACVLPPDGWTPPAPRRPPHPNTRSSSSRANARVDAPPAVLESLKGDVSYCYSLFIDELEAGRIKDIFANRVLCELKAPLIPPREDPPEPRRLTVLSRTQSASELYSSSGAAQTPERANIPRRVSSSKLGLGSPVLHPQIPFTGRKLSTCPGAADKFTLSASPGSGQMSGAKLLQGGCSSAGSSGRRGSLAEQKRGKRSSASFRRRCSPTNSTSALPVSPLDPTAMSDDSSKSASPLPVAHITSMPSVGSSPLLSPGQPSLPFVHEQSSLSHSIFINGAPASSCSDGPFSPSSVGMSPSISHIMSSGRSFPPTGNHASASQPQISTFAYMNKQDQLRQLQMQQQQQSQFNRSAGRLKMPVSQGHSTAGPSHLPEHMSSSSEEELSAQFSSSSANPQSAEHLFAFSSDPSLFPVP